MTSPLRKYKPGKTVTQTWSNHSKTSKKISGAYQQSQDLCSALRSLASFYFQSRPGPDTIASNTTSHNHIRQALRGQVPQEDFDHILNELLYRTVWVLSSELKSMRGSCS